MRQLTCPHCGFSKEIAATAIPAGVTRATCPKCRQRFALDAPPPEPQPSSAAAETIAPPPRTQLLPLGALFDRSWLVCKERLLTLLGISLLGYGLLLLGSLLLGGLVAVSPEAPGLPWLPGLLAGTVGAVGGMLLMTVMTAAMVYALIDTDLHVRHTIGYALQNFGGFFWVLLLNGFIIVGGSLLLVLPGLLFFAWFVFAPFLFAEEGVRGMEALLKSRAYVRGRELPVCGRLLLVALFGGALSAIPLFGTLLALLVMPVTLIFQYEIYRDLRQLKGSISYPVSRIEKAKWLSAGAFGHLALLVGLLLLGSVAFKGMTLFSGMVLWDAGTSTELTVRVEKLDPPPPAPRPQPTAPPQAVPQSVETGEGGEPGAEESPGAAVSEDEPTVEAVISYPSPLLPVAPPAELPELSPSAISVPLSGGDGRQLLIAVEGLNVFGEVRINGDALHTFAVEPDTVDSHVGSVWLEAGSNTLDISYSVVPYTEGMRVRVVIYTPDEVYGSWSYRDRQGDERIMVYLED
ncbi:MAG: hypothetical protein RQ723_09005 [Desulfuromonadales bacterium]|nr:hypothetical protein [Desulfuromonadales bacterium]